MSDDFTIKIWDIEAGAAKLSLKLGDVVQSLSWSANGSLMVTTSRDKKLRIWDVRQERPIHEGHKDREDHKELCDLVNLVAFVMSRGPFTHVRDAGRWQ